MRCQWALIAILFTINATLLAGNDAQGSDDARKAAWQSELEHETFHLDQNQEGVMYSLLELDTDCKVEMTYDHHKPFQMEFKLLRNGKVVTAVDGNIDCVFCGTKGIFCFAKFERSDCGCKVLAFSTVTGKKLWERQLAAVGVAGHSAYSNRINMNRGPVDPGDDQPKSRSDAEKDKGSLIITGNESFGDYNDVLDMQTGTVLAHKVYRSVFK